MNSDEIADISTLRCLFLPLREYNLIIPYSSVDEILPFAVVENDDAEGFIVGKLLWRRDTIPLVSFEVLNNQEKPEIRRRTRAAVMHVNTENTATAIQNFAIILSGMPKMLVISDADLLEVDEEHLPNCTSREVEVNGEKAYIPDFDALEYILHKKYKNQ